MFPLAARVTALLLLLVTCLRMCLCQAPESSSQRLPTNRELRIQGVERFLEPGLGVSVLLLEPERGALFVGARGAVLRLPAANISSKPNLVIPWEESETEKKGCTEKGKPEDECHNHVRALHLNGSRLLACGTGAFNPVCAHFDPNDGSQLVSVKMSSKFLYNPTLSCSSVLAGQDLYLATTTDFLGHKHEIFRTGGSQTTLKIPSSAAFLKDPVFVASEVQPGEGGDPGHVYVFFTESALENEYKYILDPRVARVARVCTDDKGGKNILQNRWTSFVKLGLECMEGKLRLPFSILHDVSTLRRSGQRDSNTSFYALLSMQWGDLPYSAVCEYTLSDVEAAFARSLQRTFSIQRKGSSIEADLRLGTCITPELRALGIESSQDLPDDYLAWMQENPRLHETLPPRGGRPLLLSRSDAYTRVATTWATALDNRTYLVLYLGTRNGSVHKAVRMDGETRIVSQTQLFAPNESIISIVVSAITGTLYVAASSGVAQLSLHGCSAHDGCERCLRARDPFCAWDPSRSLCSSVRPGDPPRNWLQNTSGADSKVCNVRIGTNRMDSAESVPPGHSFTLLDSSPQSTDTAGTHKEQRTGRLTSNYYGAMVTGWFFFTVTFVAVCLLLYKQKKVAEIKIRDKASRLKAAPNGDGEGMD